MIKQCQYIIRKPQSQPNSNAKSDAEIFAKGVSKPLQSIKEQDKRATSSAKEINGDVLGYIGKGQ